MKFDQFTVVLLLTPPDAPKLDDASAAELQDAHLRHLAALHEGGSLLAAGPLPGEPRRRFRGLNIFGTGPDEARSLAERDPAVRAGQFEIEVLPCRARELSAFGRRGGRLGIDRDVSRLGGDALEPVADRRIRREVEAALVGDVGVRVESEVRERQPVADEVVAAVEVVVHGGKRPLTRRLALG
ncbi:MAG: hypothetical protein E6G03_12200 [Actinobacteria bacterium]|nr:MAG: hypothetical protein E6G03_12200 [Actinomycetota bacterium]